MTIVTGVDETRRPDLFWSVVHAFEPRFIKEGARVLVLGRLAVALTFTMDSPVRNDRVVTRPTARLIRRN